MDYQNDKDSWEWQGRDCRLKKDCNREMAKCMLNGVSVIQNEDDISYMLEETTPVKACGDLVYHFNNSEIMSKTPQEYKEYTSQVKRRRVLEFDETVDDISSSFLKSKERIDSFDDIDILPEVSQWEACLQEDLCFEDLAQSEAWLADCLIDTDMNISSDDGNALVTSDFQIGYKEVCDDTPFSGSSTAHRAVRSSRNIVFKGRKSYMKTPTKLASSVVYPFDFIKPCGVRGDVTLKDINQRILTPPPTKPKQVKEASAYPTSAITGKPVVGKTKIPTQGGKGSITIMRTKG